MSNDTKFPTAVDDPIVIDANFRFDANYARKLDNKIRAIEAAVIPLIGGGGGGSGNATSIQSIPVDATAPTTLGQVLPYDGSSKYGPPRKLSQDEILAGYVPALTFASGGTSPVEIGATITPTFNHNPLLTDPSLSAATISDTQGNGPTNRLGSSNGFQATHTTYTASSTPGTNLSFSVASTKSGVPKTATSPNITAQPRIFAGFGPSTTATGLTQSGGNATVTGPTASLTGTVPSSVVGNQTLFGSITPSSNFLWLAWDASLGSTHMFKDKLTGFAIDMQAATSFTSTTQTGVTRTYYVARSTNNLGTTAIEPYFDS